MFFVLFFTLFQLNLGYSATIAIIDTGFDLDNEFLRPKILQKDTDEEMIDFQGWDFFDNSHLKKSVIEDKSSVQEILLYRSMRAKGHRQGLSPDEFQWYTKKNSDKTFMEKVKQFKKHSHGTFVAGIALREGENINILPIRGISLPEPQENSATDKEKTTPSTVNKEDLFILEIRDSINRISKKFTKICQFVAQKKIHIVNASYGITYKSILAKFRERYKEITGVEIEETKLKILVDDYFNELYERGKKTMNRHENILFVFSAGNSGLNNDEFHHYPSKIKVPNAISVAAMNGQNLATFSNHGEKSVDIGAPGVAILSIVPKVYSHDGSELYSPSSGTSMAAPYVSNLVAQILNTNPNLKASEIKKIILETGESKNHLKNKIISSSIVDNQRALRVALLTKDFPLDQAINLGRSDLLQLEDQITVGQAPYVSPEEVKKRILESIPNPISPQEVDEELSITPITNGESFSKTDPEKVLPDNSKQKTSVPQDAPPKSVDQVSPSQNEVLLPKPSEAGPALPSESESLRP